MSVKGNESILELVNPTMEYKEQVMNYRKVFLENIEWYFDIARSIGKENNIPYEDDLYLDVLVKSNGEIVLLDEDELKEAYERLEITKEEYDEAYKTANDLINKVKGNKEKLRQFTDKYLNDMLKE